MLPCQIRDTDTAAFDAEVLRAEGPVLVEFSADWCPPCRMMEPVVADLATMLCDRLAVRRLDVDRHPEISLRYSVLGMPTLIVFLDGRQVDRLTGFASAAHVRRWVADTLTALPSRPSD